MFLTCLLCATATAFGHTASPVADSFAMTPGQFWLMNFATEQRMPTVGDADGDGHADLMSLWPVGDCLIDLARTSTMGKPIYGNVAINTFGRDGLGGACGPFMRTGADDYAGIFGTGEIRLAWGMTPGTNQYLHNDLAAKIPGELMPKAPLRTAVADFDGDGRTDFLCLDSQGTLLLFQNTQGASGQPKFTPRLVSRQMGSVRQIAAGRLDGDQRGQCVWLDSRGTVFRATILPSQAGLAVLGHPTSLLDASPDDHLAVGHFRGSLIEDVLVGQKLLPGGNPGYATTLKDVPPTAIAKDDGPWFAGDVDGNGKDDLIRVRRGPERFGGNDTYVHFSYVAGQQKGYYCTSNDGLPDFWKEGKVKPGGLDLVALGCKVGHRDVIVEVERFEDVDEAALRTNMDKVAKYYAEMPIVNPDGTTGVSIHFIYKKPLPKREHDRLMSQFDDLYPPIEHRGIVHTVFSENDGPNVSKGCGDNSHFNGGWPEFLHEFGHQLDLRHDGFWPPSTPGFPSMTSCALYPSLMSYSYSYSLNDKAEDIGYSDGSRSSYVANQFHLSEKLPFPVEKVKFLAGGPYHFHIKPSPDGKSTYVDWNWNGVFGEEDVAANINYSHGVDLGPRYDIGKAHSAPVLIAQGSVGNEKLLLLYGIKASAGTQLVLRTWQGNDRDADGAKWSSEENVEPSGVIGDPTATSMGGNESWVAYATSAGVTVRSVALDAKGIAHAGKGILVPNTIGAQPTLTSLDGRLALLLWRDSKTAVGLRFFRADHDSISLQPEVALEFTSTVPVGAVEGAKTAEGPSLWIGRMEPGGRTEVVRYQLGPDNLLRIAERRWLDGKYATHRMTLLWQKEPDSDPKAGFTN